METTPPPTGPLPPPLKLTLTALRRRRDFQAERCVVAKGTLINSYLRASGVSGCVVGVSGGVDSAVTLGLLRSAADLPGSPIRRLVAVLAPIFAAEGSTNQEIALRRGREVAAACSAEVIEADLTQGHRAVKDAVDDGLGLRGNAWSSGQLVSTIRTPALYYVTSLLTQEGDLSVLCGTTNRDEGSYIGFFGKASDGMVDLQVISDLHKSEVYALAQQLDVPTSVRQATPTGDTFDGRVDEVMIGAPYDFVELYTALITLRCADPQLYASLTSAWDEPSRAAYDAWAAAIEALHRHNHHKYISGSSAIHLDVYARHVPGGWSPPIDRTPARGRFVGEYTLAPEIVAAIDRRTRSREPSCEAAPSAALGESLVLVPALLSDDEVDSLRRDLLAQEHVRVGRHGVPEGYDPRRDPPGSRRASTYSPQLAQALWPRLQAALPQVRILAEEDPGDRDEHRVWRAVGLSPLFRGIIYDRDGALVPHYDSTFDLGDDRRTLMSVLIGLGPKAGSTGDEQACTRLILDRQRHLAPAQRDFRDHDDAAPAGDVLAAYELGSGSALCLDHRILHEGARWTADVPRVVLRADIIFRRCGPPLPTPSLPQPLPLEQLLGVRSGAPTTELDRAYQAALTAHRTGPADGEDAAKQHEHDRSRLAWRILRDPHYASAYRRLAQLDPATDAATMLRAGFLDDGRSPEQLNADADRLDPRWLCTPLHRLRARLDGIERLAKRPSSAPRRPLLVLLTTGALCPIHRGHVEMMELARDALEARGETVLGGYLSVSHDAYVLPKCGVNTPKAAARLAMCEAAIADHEWLMVDPWESLACDRAVNFTDVLRRLETYLNAHLRAHAPVEVVYVFGSDNASFALAFAERGRCVCVPRPGADAELTALRRHSALADAPRIIFGATPSAHVASTDIREGDGLGLLTSVRPLWREATTPQHERAKAPPLTLSIRDEGRWALDLWIQRIGQVDPATLCAAREEHLESICALLQRSFAAAHRPLEIVRCELAQQSLKAAAHRRRMRVLSLDPCVPGDLDLAVSRCFELAADACHRDLVARPGAAPLDVQLAALPGDDVPTILLDDDRVSGRTIEQVLAMLDGRLTIREVVVLNPPPGDASVEICDARDLLPGARAGGLVVVLPDGSIARAPYVLPYVRPSARLQVPLREEVAFSRDVWRISAAFFAAVTPQLRVEDADPAFRRLALYIGFSLTTPLRELCRWHAAHLHAQTSSPQN